MPNPSVTPRRIIAISFALLACALAAPAAALAAPEEGSGTLIASPSPFVLPPTTVGTQSAMQTVSFEYQGSGEVQVQKVAIEGPEAGEFVGGGTNCSVLSEAQKCDAWVALKPGAEGLKQATLKVVFVGLHPEESFEVSGRGVPAQISLDPTSFDFGLHRVNRENAIGFFQLSNDGEGEVQLGNLEIGGDTSAFWTPTSSCWGVWLAPGQSCSIEVDFNPHEVRPYAAELRASAHGTTATAALSGEGGRAIIEPPPGPVDLGTATVGSQGEVRSITLQNTGNLPEAFFIGIVAGGDSGSFRLLNENCSGHEILPLDTCTAQVRFEPLGPGPKAARLAFFGDGEGGVMIELRAEGLAAATQLTPANFDFGSLLVGTKSSAQAFVVHNDGTAATQLDRVAIAGNDVGEFFIVADTCTGATLAPGAECAVRVRFWPDEAGDFAATLRVGGPSGTLSAALSGRGLANAGSTAGVVGTGAASTAAGSASPLKKVRRHRRFARNSTIVAPQARSSRLRR
jgi:hypothetical protein